MHERKAIQARLADRQSTHAMPVTNSVGMAIRTLQGNYIPDFAKIENDQEKINAVMDPQVKKCITELNALVKDPRYAKYQAAITYISEVIKQPIDQWDQVTLYLPMPDGTYQDKQCIFPLKHTLALVWQAIQDHQKFVQAYPDSKDALAAAKEDYPQRLETFLNTLKRMSGEGVCHHGNRNELIFCLNKIYQNIDLIEDERATILMYLKDNINKKFWEVYPTSTQKKELLAALFKWLSDHDPSDLLERLKIKDVLYEKLKTLFIKNGTNPEKMKLKEIMQEAFAVLEFSCDPKKYPVLYVLKTILSEVPQPGAEERNAALDKMQAKIRQQYQPRDEEKPSDYPDYFIFYNMYITDKLLKENKTVLSLAGKWDSLKAIQQACDDYFKLGKQPDPQLFKNAKAAVEKAVFESNNDTMMDTVQNFFVKYFSGEEKFDLYNNKLLNPSFHDKVLLNDAKILAETKARIEAGMVYDEKSKQNVPARFVDFDPYLINRVFLHAILKKPNLNNWSPLFAGILKLVLQVVDEKVKEIKVKKEKNIKFDENEEWIDQSYPPQLLAQLKYYLDRYNFLKDYQEVDEKEDDAENAVKQAPQRDDSLAMILVPEQIESFAEWIQVARMSTPENQLKCYLSQSGRLNKMLAEATRSDFNSPFLDREQAFDNFQKDIDVFKNSEIIKIFLSWLGQNVINVFPEDIDHDYYSFQNGRYLSALLRKAFPEEERFEQLLKLNLNTEVLCRELTPILGILPEQDQPRLIAKLAQDFKKTDKLAGEILLATAAAKNYTEVIHKLLEKKVDINCGGKRNPLDERRGIHKNNNDRPPIFCAVIGKSLEVLQVLIENKADLSVKWNNRSIVKFAETTGSKYIKLLAEAKADLHEVNIANQYKNLDQAIEMVPLLVKFKCDLNKFDDRFGYSIVYHAVDKNNEKLLNILVEHKANLNNVNKENNLSLVGEAAKGKKYEMVKLLIRLKANVDPPEGAIGGLQYALEQDNFEMVRYLLEQKADPAPVIGKLARLVSEELKKIPEDKRLDKLVQFKLDPAILYSNADDLDSILSVLLGEDYAKKLRMLAEAKVSLNKAINPVKFVRNNPEALRALIECKADVHCFSYSLARYAVCDNNMEMLKLLAKNKINFNKQPTEFDKVTQDTIAGLSLLALAAQNGNFEMCKFLVEQKIDVNEFNKDSYDHYTAVCIAASGENSKILKYLLDQKANINIKSRTGTPLDVAIRIGNKENIVILIKHLQNNQKTNNEMVDPVSIAAMEGNLATLKTLADYKANLNITTPKGFTPLIYALQESKLEAVQFFIEQGCPLDFKSHPKTIINCFRFYDKPFAMSENFMKELDLKYDHLVAATVNFISSIPETQKQLDILNDIFQGKNFLSQALQFDLRVSSKSGHKLFDNRGRKYEGINRIREHFKKILKPAAGTSYES